MKAQLILELRIATEFAIAKNFTETLNKTKKGVCGRHRPFFFLKTVMFQP